MDFKITDKVIVQENNLLATVVGITDTLIMVEFEDESEFGYSPLDLTLIND